MKIDGTIGKFGKQWLQRLKLHGHIGYKYSIGDIDLKRIKVWCKTM
jgi:hypothetical protein